eukprot:TRINITY_DN55234_c0_g1_i1.p1 TRINITY_DN55234_c0_g1~~TRINITY_DN55234_c0_g1_i1.p1  ORF type:complete len:209 (+),score=75.97 TRINITY_DN55234_c0_g1_i1:74-700(+)
MVSLVERGSDLDAALKETPNAVVHFAAEWCQPCKDLHKEMGTWQTTTCRLICAMAEQMPEKAEELGVETVPHIVFFRDGKKVHDIAGAKVADIQAKMGEIYADAPRIDTSARLKALISRDPVMLFMKGNPEAPRCGFSRQIVDILNQEGVKYGTFDILTDEAVRQGLKELSQWPTYPQLYVKGELVGGLDIVKELKEGGELGSTLRGE